MKTIETQINRQYAITATTTCTVTANDGMLLCTVQPGEQKIFTAIGNHVEVSDNHAVVSLLFGKFCDNRAAQLPRPYHSGTMPSTLQAGHIYDLGQLTENTDFSALKLNETANCQTIELWFSTGSSVPTITWPANGVWVNSEEPLLSLSTAYRFVLRREPNGNLIINLAYEYSI